MKCIENSDSVKALNLAVALLVSAYRRTNDLKLKEKVEIVLRNIRNR